VFPEGVASDGLKIGAVGNFSLHRSIEQENMGGQTGRWLDHPTVDVQDIIIVSHDNTEVTPNDIPNATVWYTYTERQEANYS